MEKSLDELFDTGDDFSLCNDLFVRICEAHGNDVDLTALCVEQRTLFLVWWAFGIIGNGGFRYLLEHQLPGDPYFALTCNAYEVIGSKKAFEAFRRVLAVFPRSRPQWDIMSRLKWYVARINGWPTKEDDLYFQASSEIKNCLAVYARSKRQAFMSFW